MPSPDVRSGSVIEKNMEIIKPETPELINSVLKVTFYLVILPPNLLSK